jgi:initiation factor 1A
MVKNTTGGNKHKKQKNHSTKKERELTIKEDENEFYGQVTTFLGGNMVKVRKLGTLIEYRCKLRKALPRIHKNDIVLYAIRDFGSNEIGDVLLVYTPEELMILKREKYIEEDIKINEIDDAIIFDNEEKTNDNEEETNDNKEKEINIDDI